jgi:hypothetical protein
MPINCPKCNFQIPDTLVSHVASPSATTLKKKTHTFTIGDGDSKKTFVVKEPTNKKRDEYIDLTTAMAQMEAEKRDAIRNVNEQIASFSFGEDGETTFRNEQEREEFQTKMAVEMEKIHAMPNPSDRAAVEFFLGKIDDDAWYEEEMVPSVVSDVITTCENELCHLEQVRKNLENLLPQTMLMSSKVLKKFSTL